MTDPTTDPAYEPIRREAIAYARDLNAEAEFRHAIAGLVIDFVWPHQRKTVTATYALTDPGVIRRHLRAGLDASSVFPPATVPASPCCHEAGFAAGIDARGLFVVVSGIRFRPETETATATEARPVDDAAPFKGLCGRCGKPVYHHYPWYDKNPLTHADARPYHEGCFVS